jgi:hypothetical protein
LLPTFVLAFTGELMESTKASTRGTAGMRVALNEGEGNESNKSGVSWPAVWAGGFVTAALSLILLALGAGLGFASVSVWSGSGVSASKVGAGAILWLIIIQLISATIGGYLAGRLRTKWTGIHGDEVYFRDTAHGFLAWSVALVVTAAFLTSAATALTGSSVDPARNGGSASRGDLQPNAYYIDNLFRGDGSKSESELGPASREAATIFAFALQHGELYPADKSYLDQMVMAKTGASQADADKRVSDAFASAQTAAEAARKALAHTLLWIFVALLIGAFCASFAGTIGGRQRDHVAAV